MKRTFFALLLLASPTLHAALRGTVFATGGTAVGNARVAVYRREAVLDEHERIAAGREREVVAQTTSNAQGAFAIEAKLQGAFDLEVVRDGYAPWRQSVLADSDELAVELVPAPARSGRVTAGGKPVAGAVVVADDGLHVKWSGRTDDKGAFTIPDPAGWGATLRVLHPDHAMLLATAASSKLELALVPGTSVSGKVVGANRRAVANAKLFTDGWPAGTTREDGTFTIAHLPADVTTIFALAGGEHGSARRSAAEITITLEASNAISGVVRDPKDRPLAGARVFALPKAQGISWDDARAAISDEKGNYRIDACDAKDYQVMADAADLQFESAVTTLRSTRTARLDFTAKLRNYLTGTVVDARKKPVAGARVQLTTADAPLVYIFSDAFGTGAATAADGRFRLPVAQFGAHGDGAQVRVQAIHPQYAVARAEVKLGGSLPPVTITLPDGIEVRGTVKDKDGKAVSGAGVLPLQDPFGIAAFPVDALLSSGRGRAVVESDAEGRFTLHLNEAPHSLSVWKEGFAPFRVAEMTPAAGQKPIEVVLEPGVEIRGRITAKSGSVPAGGMLIADFGGAYMTGTIAADQSFVVPGLTPGLYTLRYMTENGRFSAEKTVKAPATDVVIELPATGEIRGRVIDKATNVVLPHFSIRTMVQDDFNSEDFDGVETFVLPSAVGPVSVTASADGYISETQQVGVDEKKPAMVTFALTRGRTISGRVTTEAGDPIAEAQVSIESDDFNGAASTMSTQDGEFEIAGARREPVTLSVVKAGFTERKVEVEGETDRRVSVVLSTGRKAVGRVVTAGGEPVSDAQIWAVSPNGASQQTKSSADGAFVVTGLSDGRYSFHAMRSDLGRAELEDVDPAAAPLVITFPASKGAGTIHGTVQGYTDGNWTSGGVMISPGAQGGIRRDGTYRVENIAAGEVEVRAYAINNRDQIMSAPVSATVVANEDVEVNLVFRADIVIRGTVTEAGQPAIGRSVEFTGTGTTARTKTDEHGVYELKALEPGLYQVEVDTQRQSYTTRYQVVRSATFDIAVSFAQISGRAVDEAGAPQALVSIEVKSSDAESGETVVTDGSGTFTANVNEGKHYVVTATKKGFATAVQQVDNTRTPVVLTLVRSAGLRVRLTDARDGKSLRGYVVATNAAGLIAARADDPEKDGAYAVPLASGAYRVSVSANGYASQSVRVTVPSQAEVRLALTPGGNLIVRTEKALGDLVKLVMPDGEEYVRCQCNGIAEIRLTGTTTTIDHVAPGRYTMQVLDAEGRIKTSYPVTIEEGGTTVAEIHIPD